MSPDVAERGRSRKRIAETRGESEGPAVWAARFRRGKCPSCGERKGWGFSDFCTCCQPCWEKPHSARFWISCPACKFLREQMR